MRRSSWLSLLFPVVLLSAGTVWGDVFVLANGGRIEGDLLNPDQSPRTSYVVQIRSGGRLTLLEDQVEQVLVKSEVLRRYEAFLPNVADTAEGHWDAAERCGKAGLKEQREFHLQQVLRHEPEHEGARYALGYSRVDGRWVRQEDWMAKQGYVRYRGAWRLQQELELEKAAEEDEEHVIFWRKKLRIWRSWIVKGRDKQAEGEGEIRRIRDVHAAPVLAELLQNDKEPKQLKLLYIDVLGELGGAQATVAMVKLALEDPDAAVRDRCLDQLAKAGSRAAVSAFLAALKHDERLLVLRAATALARMKDPSATAPLIEALITEHKVLVGGSGLKPTFSNTGDAGLSIGGGPKVEKREFKNEEVLAALTALHPGVNFGYNKEAWKKWYASENTPRNVNLRRSD